MICEPCRRAGDMNANLSVINLTESETKAFKNRIAHVHKQCHGCDCQHKIGSSHIERGPQKKQVSSAVGDGGTTPEN